MGKRVKLTAGQTVRMGDWLREKRAWLERDQPSQRLAAEHAAVDLRFSVPVGALANLARDLDMDWPGGDPRVDPVTREALKTLTAALADLYNMHINDGETYDPGPLSKAHLERLCQLAEKLGVRLVDEDGPHPKQHAPEGE